MNRLAAIIGDGGGGDWLREGKGITQRTYILDPWTWTMVWGLNVRMGAGRGEDAKGEK